MDESLPVGNGPVKQKLPVAIGTDALRETSCISVAGYFQNAMAREFRA
jgi:hypothetical protein